MACKKKRKNKKAAFEMSITTIVILVIALSLLIFGLIFVRNIMCSGMDIMSDVNSGTQKEIDNLFSSKGGEVVCLGEGDKVQAVYPSNELQKVYCGFNIDTSTTFTFTVNINQATIVFKDPSSTLTDATLRQWLRSALPSNGQVSVTAGSKTLTPIAYMQIPKDADQVSFQIPVTVQRTGGSPETKLLAFQIKRAGAVQSAIC